MRVLFVCRSNGARSQQAEAFFKKLHKNNNASSAGIIAEKEGKVGTPPGSNAIKVMKKFGCDISKKRRRQITKEMVNKSDKVVLLLSRSERRKYMPSYLKTGKTVFWDVRDMRKVNSMPKLMKRAREIRIRVRQMRLDK